MNPDDPQNMLQALGVFSDSTWFGILGGIAFLAGIFLRPVLDWAKHRDRIASDAMKSAMEYIEKIEKRQDGDIADLRERIAVLEMEASELRKDRDAFRDKFFFEQTLGHQRDAYISWLEMTMRSKYKDESYKDHRDTIFHISDN